MAKKVTRKDLERWYDNFSRVRIGYCCFADDKKSTLELAELGYNSGVYGWNWSAYADYKTDTLYISHYRGVPAYMKNKG